jgi:hypothetical protein
MAESSTWVRACPTVYANFEALVTKDAVVPLFGAWVTAR